MLAELSRESLKEINKELVETTSQISKEIGQSKEYKTIYEQQRETLIKVIIICRQGRGFHHMC